ncbi:MAG: hypothetical protein GF307_07425 [candidate division Zixibacteria bacterium]|nr:hypothetical protein [candidate division Zixibacteria bacterium]
MAQPVDLQNVLAKTQATEKIAKLEKARPEVAQKQGATDFQVKVEDKKKKVPDTDKKDEVIIRKEQKGNEQEQKKGKKNSKEEELKKDEQQTPDNKNENEDIKHIDLLA